MSERVKIQHAVLTVAELDLCALEEPSEDPQRVLRVPVPGESLWHQDDPTLAVRAPRHHAPVDRSKREMFVHQFTPDGKHAQRLTRGLGLRELSANLVPHCRPGFVAGCRVAGCRGLRGVRRCLRLSRCVAKPVPRRCSH